jgi:hypothetical protein
MTRTPEKLVNSQQRDIYINTLPKSVPDPSYPSTHLPLSTPARTPTSSAFAYHSPLATYHSKKVTP